MRLTYFIERLLGFDFAGCCVYALAHQYPWAAKDPDDLIPFRPIYIAKPTRKWYDPHGRKLWEYYKTRFMGFWLKINSRRWQRKHRQI